MTLHCCPVKKFNYNVNNVVHYRYLIFTIVNEMKFGINKNAK